MVGPGGVPTLCNSNDLICPTGLNAPYERKRQFPELSNPARRACGKAGADAMTQKVKPVPTAIGMWAGDKEATGRLPYSPPSPVSNPSLTGGAR